MRYNLGWYDRPHNRGGIWEAIELPEVLHRVGLLAGPGIEIDISVYPLDAK